MVLECSRKHRISSAEGPRVYNIVQSTTAIEAATSIICKQQGKAKTGMLPLGSENRNPHASHSETETGEKIAPTPNRTEDDELRAYKDKYTHFFV